MNNLEDEIAAELATQMQSEMDFHILSDMLVKMGWKKVELARFYSNRQAIDIKLWCEQHIRKAWRNHGTSFVFENTGDAVMFTLKWAN